MCFIWLHCLKSQLNQTNHGIQTLMWVGIFEFHDEGNYVRRLNLMQLLPTTCSTKDSFDLRCESVTYCMYVIVALMWIFYSVLFVWQEYKYTASSCIIHHISNKETDINFLHSPAKYNYLLWFVSCKLNQL